MTMLFRSVLLLALLASLAAAHPAHAAPVTRAALSTLSNLVTISLSRHERFDVLSSSDVREVVALEAEKQSLGCESDASCLAEVAGAMGARLVVFGQLGQLGTLYVLTLNLFDSEAASAAGRVVAKGASLESLAEQMDGAVDRLVGKMLAEPDAQRVKVLVLDLKAADAQDVLDEPAPAPAASASAAEPPSSFPWLLASGGGTFALGLVVVLAGAGLAGAGIVAEGEARAARFQDEAKAKLDEANGYGLGANASFAFGGLLLVAGAGVAALQLFVGGGE